MRFRPLFKLKKYEGPVFSDWAFQAQLGVRCWQSNCPLMLENAYIDEVLSTWGNEHARHRIEYCYFCNLLNMRIKY